MSYEAEEAETGKVPREKADHESARTAVAALRASARVNAE